MSGLSHARALLDAREELRSIICGVLPGPDARRGEILEKAISNMVDSAIDLALWRLENK